jgi:hypothetical protein
MMYLSKGGRVTLIKNNLSNLPTSYLFFSSRLSYREIAVRFSVG